MIRWLVLLATVAIAMPARADEAAYRLEETAWNGLSSLALVAENVGVVMTQEDALDLSDGGPDVLFLIHPTAPLQVDALLTWVRGGGRLFVADDFGQATELLAAFGLTRELSPRHEETFDDNLAIPLIGRVGDHPLSYRVHRLALNHPSALRGPGLPVFAFDDGSGAVYDMSLGEGVAVLHSDPSALTNLMLPLRGNGRFVLNTFERLCPANPCHVVVVTQDGRVDGPVESSGVGPQLDRDWRSKLSAFLERMRDVDVDPRALRAASILLVSGVLLLLGTLFPSRVKWPFRPPRKPRGPTARSEFEFHFHRLRNGEARTYALPAAEMKQRFEPLFYSNLQLALPDHPNTEFFARATAAYLSRYEPGAGRGRARRVTALLRGLNGLGQSSATRSARTQWVDAKTLHRWYTDAHGILTTMDLDERFDADTARPGTHS